jgi:hypothetical protein
LQGYKHLESGQQHTNIYSQRDCKNNSRRETFHASHLRCLRETEDVDLVFQGNNNAVAAQPDSLGMSRGSASLKNYPENVCVRLEVE